MTDTDVLELSAIIPERRRALLKTMANPSGLRADGEEYELLDPAEMSLVQLAEVGREQQSIQRLFEKDPEKAEAALNRLVGVVLLQAPVEDIAQLPFITKIGVLRDFTNGVSAAYATQAPPAATENGEREQEG